jgi:hypothetical protein
MTDNISKTITALFNRETEAFVAVPEGVDAAFVRTGATITKNMGNYNSLKVEVTVQSPVPVESIAEATDALAEFCKARALEMLPKKEAK